MIKRTIQTIAMMAATLTIAMFAINAHGHGGGKDEWGGHTNRSTGEYHCHVKDDERKAELCRMYAELKNAKPAAACPECPPVPSPVPSPVPVKTPWDESPLCESLRQNYRSASTDVGLDQAFEHLVESGCTNQGSAIKLAKKDVQECNQQLGAAKDSAIACGADLSAVRGHLADSQSAMNELEGRLTTTAGHLVKARGGAPTCLEERTSVSVELRERWAGVRNDTALALLECLDPLK